MNSDPLKQVLVLRTDLNMRKGKMIVQGAHAAMLFMLDKLSRGIPFTSVEEAWMKGLHTKVCLGIDSLTELIRLHNQAVLMDIPSFIMYDEGFTEFNGERTITAVGIGPWNRNEIDKVTGHLKPL